MMKRFPKQLVCWLLTAVMVAGLLPASALTPPAVPDGAEVKADWKTDLRPADGTTQGQPFPEEGILGGDFFRIPALITIENGEHEGRIVAMTDARWKHMGDGNNIDTLLSYSDDNGATWHYSFPNFFGDTQLAVKPTKSAIFIDPVLAQDKEGNLYLMADACPAGHSTWGGTFERPEVTNGFVEIGGVSRMPVYTSPENSAQDDDNYSYYIGDFASIGGSETKYAPILNAGDDTQSGFYTDDHFYLYYTEGTKDPAGDKIYCAQMDGSNNPTDTWVQQNLFFYNATLHLRNAQFLYLIKSTDGGETWSAPKILNDQVRTGEHNFYGPGPGAGTYLDDGTIILPCYHGGSESSSFIYSTDGGETWTRTESLTVGSSESTIVQIDDTTVRQFYRSGSATLRYVDYTKDAAGVWTPTNIEVDTGAVRRSGNQLAAIRYSKQVEGKTIVMVSTATSANGGNAWSRWHGVIHTFAVNADKTMTLLFTTEINGENDWYGYSSLAELPDGSLGLLYESSHTDASQYTRCSMQYVAIPADIPAISLAILAEQGNAMEQENYYEDAPGAWDTFQTALTTANEVLENESATTEQVESAAAALKAAMANLSRVEVVISGTVTDETGAAVIGATVTLENASYRPVGLTATTDAAGSFSFSSTKEHILDIAPYQLKIQATGYQVNTFAAGAITKEKPTSRTVCALVAEEPGAYVNNFDSGDISMMGTLTTETSGIPTYEAVTYNGSGALKITFNGGGNQGTSRNLNNAVDKTEAAKIANGVVSFDITGLTNTVRLGITLRGTAPDNRIFVGQENAEAKWFWEWWNGSSSDYERTIGTKDIGIYPGETRRVLVELNGANVKVFIDGVQIYNATMNGAPTGAGYVGINMTQNSGTSYILDNLHIVSADAPAENAYTVEGTVTTADGAPVPGASVDVYSGDTLVTGTTTNANGVYKTQALAQGTYTVKVSAPGYPEKTGEITVSGENLTAQNFVLAADKTALQAAYDAVKDMANDNYTAASWNTFLDARTAAEILLENAAATQDAVDAALAALNTAKNALAKNPTTPDTPSKPNTPSTPSSPSTSNSSSSSTATTVTTRDDGAKVTTETKPDGTKTETVEEPDGTKSVTETKKDGTVTETVEEPDGTKAVTETKPDGSKTATVEQPDGVKSETVTTAEGDTTITVTDPEGEALVKAEIPAAIPAPEAKFEDIEQTPWAAEAIHNMAGLELVKGIGGNKYDPVTPMTRGALATVLHRLSNGKTDYEVAFKDVVENRYYTEGVAWAAKANVVKGVSEDIFAPDQIITREQLAVMLARYAKLIGMDTKADTAALDEFADGGSTGTWAVDGMAWCVENGILKGKGANTLDPTANVSRAEVAVMLDRFITLIKK